MPRLPSRSELELVGLVVIAALCALYMSERRKVAERDAAIAARPAVDDRRAVREEKGPETIHRKFGPPPAPTPACPRPEPVLLEETVSRGPSKREELVDRKETPAQLPARPKNRWALLTLDPGQSFTPRRLQGGISFLDSAPVSPMVGASYDWRYHAGGLEVGARW